MECLKEINGIKNTKSKMKDPQDIPNELL